MRPQFIDQNAIKTTYKDLLKGVASGKHSVQCNAPKANIKRVFLEVVRNKVSNTGVGKGFKSEAKCNGAIANSVKVRRQQVEE